MVQTLNFINLSSQQAPNDVDWAGLVNSGVQGVLIRLGHGIICDPCASGHIAKAKQYGLYWHGYHTYEGVVNEPQFTIKNANELGLSTSQYYFVDLTKSSDPFNDYYAFHANWLSQGYSTGLFISSNDYLSKFTDSDVTASGTLRWLISDTEPANYDIWQYSSEGTIGTSSVKVGFNFAKTDKLKYNLNTTLTGADISKDPYNPQAPVGGAYIGWGYDTTGLGGGKTIGYSTNGKNFYALIGPDGLVVRKSDGNRIYGTIADQIDSAISANVIPAKSAADSAVAYANDAVEKSKVNSQAIDDINSAVSDAKQGANDAMSRAKSAWDVATGAKEAVTDFDPLLKSAQSDASNAIAQIADTASALSDAKAAFTSDVAVAKNLASTAQTTADSAVKSVSSVANDLTAVASQAKANANGITKVTSDVGLLQTTVADNSGNISKIQETASQIQQAVSDNAGNITVAKQTADSAVAVASDAHSNATVAIQTASQASITAQNASGQAASSVLTANGAMTTASDAKSNATVAVQTASGASLTAINANSDATVAKQTASEAKVQASNAESDFAQLSIRANKIEANVANNSGAITSVQQTANGLTTTVGKVDNRVKKIEDNTNWTTETGPLDMNTLTTIQNIYYRDTNLKNADGETGWAYIQVVSTGERVTQTVWHDRSSIQHTRTGALNGSTYDWDAWNEVATNAQVVQVKQTVDGIATTINDPKTGLNATYQTAAGNATTISNVKSDVYQLETTANGLTSRVGNLESKTNTQETAIEQNKNAITLKADQTDVDKINGTVSQLQSTLTVQAGQIQDKVTSSQVTGMLSGYATQDYTQSLVTQKADQWNLNLTRLQTDVNAIKTTGGGVNLLTGTSGDLQTKQFTNSWNSGPQATNANYKIKLVKGQTYMYRVWIDNTSGLGNAFVNVRFIPVGGSDYNLGSGTPITQGETGYSALLITPSADGYACFTPFAYGSPQTFTAKWKGEMLEEGTVAHTWSPAPSDMATVTSVTNLSATVDGIQAQVYNSDGSSRITQLSNLIQTKVGTDDFNNLKQAVDLQTLDSADINNMKTSGHYFVHNLANNPVGGWVYVDVTGDGSTRIRQDVYQDNGTKHKYRRWYGTNWTDWEEGATYTEINQLQDAINLRVTKGDLISQINLQAGTSLIQSNKLVLDAGTTVFTGDAFIPSAAIANLTADDITTGTLKGVDIDFRNSSGKGVLIKGSKITFDDGPAGNDAGYLSFSGVPIADWPDGTAGNELQIKYGESLAIVDTSNTTPRALFSAVNTQIGYYQQGNSPSDWGLTGLKIDNSDRHFNLGVWETDSTWARVEAAPHNIQMQANDAHAWLDGNVNVFHIYRDNDGGSATSTELQVDGWAWVRGFVEAAGHSQHSALSTKTDIQPVDDDKMLKMVNDTDLTTFLYKTDVASGETHRHIGLIIDDVHDVAQYQTPQEFIAPNGVSRDDDNMIGALFGAVKALTKRIKTLESKVG